MLPFVASLSSRQSGRGSVGPLSIETVLQQETAAIHGGPDPVGDEARERGGPAPDRRGYKFGVGGDDADECRKSAERQHAFYQGLNNLKNTSLCLSGGGIRSAA